MKSRYNNPEGEDRGMKSVLVTRPQPAGDEFAEKLQREGFRVYMAPMMTYVELDTPLDDIEDYQAIIFTSVQAVQVFSGHMSSRDTYVLAVGDATAQAARKSGFMHVYSARGDSDDVAYLLKTKSKVLALRRVLHLCSDDTTDDIGNAVAGLGIEVVRRPIYKAQLLDRLPDTVLQALQHGKVDTVTLFSARTAENLVKLFLQKDLRGVSARMEVICISDRVADAAKSIPWKSIRIAHQPHLEAIMDILRTAAPNPGSSGTIAVDQVINAFGGVRPLANRLGITASTVQGWKKRGLIPEGRIEAVMTAAKEDHIDTDKFWHEGDKKVAGGKKTDIAHERRARVDRRQKLAFQNEHGLIQSNFYTGVDRRQSAGRRAYEKRQQELIFQEKLRFINRSALTFSFIFIALVLVGVFLMAPEYLYLKDRAKLADMLEGQLKEKRTETDKTSFGGVLNSKIEKIQSAANSVADMTENLSSAAQEALANPDLPDFSRVLINIAALRSTPEGDKAVTRSLETLRKALSQSPGQPEEINKAITQARRHDSTLNALLGDIDSKDVAAASMLLVLNEFRSNVTGNRPYAEDLAMLQKFAGNDPRMNKALHRLSPYAKKGVMSRTALQEELKGMAVDIVKAKLTGQDISIQEQAFKRLNKLSQAAHAEEIKGTETDAVVARAQILLNQGDVKGAMRELRTLEGASAEAAEPWMDNAEEYVVADQSSDVLTLDMLQGITGDAGNTVSSLFTLIKENIAPAGAVYLSPAMQNGNGSNSSSILAPAAP